MECCCESKVENARLRQQHEALNKEVVKLNNKLKIIQEEKDELISKYEEGVVRLQEADTVILDLKSKLLKQVKISEKVKELISTGLEDTKTINNGISKEEEAQQIAEEEKVARNLMNFLSGKASQTVTDKHSMLEQEVSIEQKEVWNQIQLSQIRKEEFLAGIIDKLKGREKDVSTLTQMHERHESESSNLVKELEEHISKVTTELDGHILNMELELESLQNQKREAEEHVFLAESSQLNKNFDHTILPEIHQGQHEEIKELEGKISNLKLELELLQNNKKELDDQFLQAPSQFKENLDETRSEVSKLTQIHEVAAQIQSIRERCSIIKYELTALIGRFYRGVEVFSEKTKSFETKKVEFYYLLTRVKNGMVMVNKEMVQLVNKSNEKNISHMLQLARDSLSQLTLENFSEYQEEDSTIDRVHKLYSSVEEEKVRLNGYVKKMNKMVEELEGFNSEKEKCIEQLNSQMSGLISFFYSFGNGRN